MEETVAGAVRPDWLVRHWAKRMYLRSARQARLGRRSAALGCMLPAPRGAGKGVLLLRAAKSYSDGASHDATIIFNSLALTLGFNTGHRASFIQDPTDRVGCVTMDEHLGATFGQQGAEV